MSEPSHDRTSDIAVALRQSFHLILIRPSRYDDDGYPIIWRKSTIPANSLACLAGIAQDCRERRVLGDDVDIVVHTFDESNIRIRPKKLIGMIRRAGGKALVAFTGVQSNQFPRAVDLAEPFLDAGIPVCVGGFHVTGCMAMLSEMPPEMRAANDKGVSFFLGEAEDGRLDAVLRDALAGALKPVYDYTKSLPALGGQPRPTADREAIRRSQIGYGSFDLGRGCPFECSFCCIINVQGRSSRYRSVEDLILIIEDHARIGVTRFFITDDNFARNRNWEQFLDCLIDLREERGLRFTLIIQVDTLCHKIPNFIDKSVRAGVEHVFVGLENINADSLAAAKKRQNKITDYREMFLAWKERAVIVSAGYIIGFPNDTRESLLRDLEVIKRELPIDLLSLTILTPLPGSQDHRDALARGAWMDPDLNKYDLTHAVTRHPNFAEGELDAVYDEMRRSFYAPEHCWTVLERTAALAGDKRMMTVLRLIGFGLLGDLHKIQLYDVGFNRRKYRRDRRPGLPLENPVSFHARRLAFNAYVVARVLTTWVTLDWKTARLWSDPRKYDYRDAAIAPASEAEFETHDLFTKTRGGTEAVAKFRKIRGIVGAARERGREKVEA